MEKFNEIVELSQAYPEADYLMKERHHLWKESKSSLVITTLTNIKDNIILNNSFFDRNLFVDKLKHGNLICLRAGNIPVTNSKEIEYGFQIHFFIIPNGKVNVGYYENSTYKNTQFNLLHTFEDLNLITEEEIIKLVYKGLKASMKSSFLF